MRASSLAKDQVNLDAVCWTARSVKSHKNAMIRMKIVAIVLDCVAWYHNSYMGMLDSVKQN